MRIRGMSGNGDGRPVRFVNPLSYRDGKIVSSAVPAAVENVTRAANNQLQSVAPMVRQNVDRWAQFVRRMTGK